MESETTQIAPVSLIEERLLSTAYQASPEDQQQARALVPEVRKKNAEFLAKSGIDLGKIEQDGYVAYSAGYRSLLTLPAGNREGFLLVFKADELQRANTDSSYEPRRYVVLGGQPNPQVYMEWEDNGKERGWYLVDERGGEPKKQSMVAREIGKEETDGHSRTDYKYDTATLDGRKISNPYWPSGYYINVRTPNSANTKTEIRSHQGNPVSPSLVEKVIT